MRSVEKVLAYKIDPQPDGTRLYENDLQTEEDIIQLFDACQLIRTMICAEGWKYLLNKFGLIGLYQVDLKSGWLDTENKQEWLESLLYHSLISGFNAQTGSFGTYDEVAGIFRNSAKQTEIIDWNRFKSCACLLNGE